MWEKDRRIGRHRNVGVCETVLWGGGQMDKDVWERPREKEGHVGETQRHKTVGEGKCLTESKGCVNETETGTER